MAQALGDAAQVLIGALPPAVTAPPMAGAAKHARWNDTCGGANPLRPYGTLRLDAMHRGARGVRNKEELAGEDLFGMARDAARDAAVGQGEETRQLSSIRRYFGCVTKLLRFGAREVRESPEAMRAVGLEMRQLTQEKKAFSLDEPCEWVDVLANDKAARIVRGQMLVALKDAQDARRMRWKARFVAVGCAIRGSTGAKIVEHLASTVPVSLTGVRVGLIYEALCWDGVTLSLDVPGAYLLSWLSGPATWLELDRSMWPKAWAGMQRPVVRVWRALYGLPRAGEDWARTARQTLTSHGYRHVTDVAEESMFVREFEHTSQVVVIFVYTDDFEIAGPREEAILVHRHVSFLFGAGQEENYVLTDFVGIQRTLVARYEDGLTHLFVHQAKYAAYTVEAYEARFMGGRPLAAISTPCDPSEAKFPNDPSERVPHIGATEAASWVGKLYWLARGTRPDLAIACQKVARRLSCWQRSDDLVLHRAMRYLRGTLTLGLNYWAHPEERSTVLLECFADTDHGGETVDTRSTTGGVCVLKGVKTFGAVEWGAKKQGSTARNTTEAELVATADVTQKAALPLSSLFEALLRRTVSVVLRNDNDTAVLDIERGYSRALAYLVKHQRLSLGAMHEDLVLDANNALVRCNTKRMLADVLTKPLDHVRHWALLAMMGMSLPSGEMPGF